MVTDITIDKVLAKMTDINTVVIADIDHYTEIPLKSHFKGVNLNDLDLRVLLDIHIDNIKKDVFKSKPTIDTMKDDNNGNIVVLAQEISELVNYDTYPDLNLLKKIWFTRKGFGRSKIKYIKAQLK